MNGKVHSLYPYPAVQYIPLLASTEMMGPWNAPPGFSRPAIHIGRNDPAWRETVRQATGLTLPPLTLSSGDFLLIALNVRPQDFKYRGNFVTVLAEPCEGQFQLLRLNEGLFYKDHIIFEVFDQDGNKLCWCAWDHARQSGTSPQNTERLRAASK